MKLKKLVAFQLVIAFILACFSLPASSLSMETSNVVDNSSVLSIINAYRTDDSINYSIKETKKLLGFNNSTYTYYQLDPCGFAIILDSTNSLMEACYEADVYSFVSQYDDYSLYYGGPEIICSINEEQFINVINGSVYNSDVILDIQDRQAYVESNSRYISTVENLQTVSSTSTRNITDPEAFGAQIVESVECDYFMNLDDFGRNVAGTCTVIAAEILLGYYDYFVDDAYVETQHRQNEGTNEAFHQYLCNYVYGINPYGGIFLSNASVGLNHYLYDQGTSTKFECYRSSPSMVTQRVISKLANNIPVAASMGKQYGGESNHSVVIYKVSYNSTSVASTAVYTCNMGYSSANGDASSNAHVVSASWFYECMYVVDSSDSHLYLRWTQYDDIYHRRYCGQCDYYYYEKHGAYWNSSTQVCSRCRYTGSYGDHLNNYNLTRLQQMVCVY